MTRQLRNLIHALGLAGGLAGAAGCGAGIASQELIAARVAYNKAQKSEAAELAPDRLLAAKQALDLAESEHEENPGSRKEAHLAYIAQRRAQLAAIQGRINAAERDRETTRTQYEKHLKARSRRVEAKLSQAQSELDKRGQELERERQARLAAEKKAAEAVASLEEIAKLKEDQRGTVITLSGAVLFKTNKADLLPIAQSSLGPVAEALKEQDASKMIVVEGHTDSRGPDAENQLLSQARAESVRSFLVSRGVPPDRIRAVGKGELAPIADNRTAEGRANNRRVEIIISGK